MNTGLEPDTVPSSKCWTGPPHSVKSPFNTALLALANVEAVNRQIAGTVKDWPTYERIAEGLTHCLHHVLRYMFCYLLTPPIARKKAHSV